jgi:hypothetical protein
MKSIANKYPLGSLTGYLISMLCALILVACGGGGGSPGINPNQPPPTATSRVANLVITTSSNTIPSSGVPGTEVTVTVLARDVNNAAVPGASIVLNTDSGAITFVTSTDAGSMPGVTDASGMVTARLSIAGLSTLRVISVTAASGSIRSETRQVTVVAATNSLSITTSSDTLQSSGNVIIGVLVRGPNNNVLTNARVLLTSSSGALIFVPTQGGSNAADPSRTDSNGMVMAQLTPGNDLTSRVITLTAVLDSSAGSSTPATRTVNVVAAGTPNVLITTNTGNLVSSGAAGTEVMVRVLVRDANNNVMPNVLVSLSANSGVLSVTGSRMTDATGLVRETLGIGNDPSLRTIRVTASIPGAPVSTTTVDVTGTRITLGSSASVNAGASTEMTVNLVDSSGLGLGGRAVTFSSANGGTVAVKNGAAAVTNNSGQLILVFTPRAGGTNDTVTVSALGSTDSKSLTINNTNSFVRGQTNPTSGASTNLDLGNINTCFKVLVHNDVAGVPTTGTVSLNSSRGNLFSNSTCTTPLTGPLTFSNGDAVAFFNSFTPGITTFVATLPNGGGSTMGAFEFVAPLTPSPRLTLQADPAIIGTNTATDMSQQSTLRVVVRDGTAANNVVSGATVNFSIVSDSSGGSLSQPSVVVTGSDGVATVNYIAGRNPTGAGASTSVTLRAEIANTNASITNTLTVARRALFITAGTGNTIGAPTNESYSQNYQVLVTDAAGNPVPGVNISASLEPTFYGKGILVFPVGGNSFGREPGAIFCPNEDKNLDGILDPLEDATPAMGGTTGNGNMLLEPGIPVALTILTPGGQTDATGTAVVQLRYARDQSNWLMAKLIIRASVSGSESRFMANFTLLGLASDFNNAAVTPPGFVSPYGRVLDCTIPN